MSVRVGTSGWSYPGGRGTWNGVFYPAKGARPRGFDELEFYARWFDVVEVNSTFYGQPRAAVTVKWAERTPAGFEFAVKLYQKFTHPAMFREATAGGAPEADATWLEQAGVVRQEDVDEFKHGIDPLAAAGKLGPLLVQFPPSFTAGPEAIDYLGWLLRTFSGTGWPSSCATAPGAIVRRIRPRCWRRTTRPGCSSTSRSSSSRSASSGALTARWWTRRRWRRSRWPRA